jgi:hypothetical protein
MSCVKSQPTLYLCMDWRNHMNNEPRPYLTAALLCERVLQEVDGSLSVIRIADKITLQMQAPPGLQQVPPPDGIQPIVPLFQLSCLIGLKSGQFVGEGTLRLKFIAPSGNIQGPPIEFKVKMLGNDQGQNVIVTIIVGAHEEGLYWVHVTLDEAELTRIPLMVVRSE